MDFLITLLMLAPILLVLYVAFKPKLQKLKLESKYNPLSYEDKKLAEEPEPKAKVVKEEKEVDMKVDEEPKKKAKKVSTKKLVRKVYHVVPADKGWLVKLAKNKTGTKFRTKAEAVAAAKKLGKEAKLGQVIVHKKDGTIQTEYTYGSDPKESKG